MSKRRNKSRLTKADVTAIIDLQRDMSFAEQIASSIIGMANHRDHPELRRIPVLLNGSDSCSCVFKGAWKAVDEKMKEYDELKSEVEELRRQLKIGD